MSARWFYRVNGQEYGLTEIALLHARQAAGTLTGVIEVRRDASATWQRLSDVNVTVPSDLDKGTAPVTEAVQTGDDDPDWFYRLAGQDLGPLSFRELTELAQQGGLTADDEIKRGIDGRYRRAGSIGRLMAAMPYAEPEQIRRVASTLSPAAVTSVAAAPSTASPVPPSLQYQPSALQPAWFAGIRGVEYGPLSLVQLSQMLAVGQISAYDFVRYGTYGGWLPASPTIEQTLAPLVEVVSAPQPADVAAHVGVTAASTSIVASATPARATSGAFPQRDGITQPAPTTPAPETVVAKHAPAPADPPPVAATRIPVSPKVESPPKVEPVTQTNPVSTPAAVAARVPESRSASTTSNESPRLAAASAPPSAASPVKRPTSQYESGGSWLDQFSLKSPVTAALIALIVVGAGYGLLQLLPMTGAERAKLETLQQILAEFRRHRDEKAADGEWNAFVEKASQKLAPIVKELEVTASRKRPVQQELLWAARDRGREMLREARQKPSASEEEFEAHLKRAAFRLGLGPDPDVGG